jgi:hypothetical protein
MINLLKFHYSTRSGFHQLDQGRSTANALNREVFLNYQPFVELSTSNILYILSLFRIKVFIKISTLELSKMNLYVPGLVTLRENTASFF